MSEHVTEIQASDWAEKGLASTQPVVVDFFSTECPPCEALAPRLEKVAADYAGRVRVYKLFRQGNRELAAELGRPEAPARRAAGRPGVGRLAAPRPASPPPPPAPPPRVALSRCRRGGAAEHRPSHHGQSTRRREPRRSRGRPTPV